MLFNSFGFLLFFPLICIAYWGVRLLIGGGKSLSIRNILLLIVSYYFYMCWQPKYALLLLTSTGVTYLAALAIERFTTDSAKKKCLVIAIVVNLAILFFYKYYNFVADSITSVMDTIGISMHIPGFDVLLPVGISFYIFQALGYLIDVYRKDIPAERNFFIYALFVSFFPQLVAGPIERTRNLLPQFKSDRPFDADFAISGFKLMLWGYFMKLCLADRCGMYVDLVFNDLSGHEGMSTLVAAFLFSFQIYGDFAGYTFIAIGCARILNISLNDNFRRPYFATTITDFWHRWHISLSTWLRDYIYFPLGGSKTTKIKTYRNIFITFLISGIWHGANWTFIVWGMLHGIIQCVERMLGWNKKQWTVCSRICHITMTFIVVTMAWVLFRANNWSDAMTALQLMFTSSDFSLSMGKTEMAFSIFAISILVFKEFIEEMRTKTPIIPTHATLKNIIYIITMIVVIGLMGVFDGGKFIYFQF